MARFDNGWVKLYRKAVMGDIGSNYTRSGLFGALIAIANIQESTVNWGGKPRKLARGQIATSLHELASLGDIDHKTVSRHLAYLQARGTIDAEKSYSGTIITINNYEQYQGQDADGPPEHPQYREGLVPTIGKHIEERKKERSKEDSDLPLSLHSMAEVWNENVESLPRVQSWTPARGKAAKTILAKRSLVEWTEACRRVEESDFLSGRDGKWNGCGFDWLLKSANLTKVLEGNYQNRANSPIDNWESKASQVIDAVLSVSAVSASVGDVLLQKLGPDLLAIVRKLDGGTGAVRALPRNAFAVKTLAGMLKEAAQKVGAA